VKRAALVTGAARGIGAATVVELARAGFSVVALDRCSDDPRLPYALSTRAELDEVVGRAQRCAGEAAEVVGLTTDTTDVAAMAASVEAAERRFGGLDVIVAAAGVIAGGVPQWHVPEEQERAVLDVCLGGVMIASRVGVPALLRRESPREGRFIAVASAAATRGLPMLAAYCAAKAGVVGLVRGLALELRGTGITANAVSPGSTATPILAESARLYGLKDRAEFAVQQPVERLLEPEEVAAMIGWLAGPSGSAVTGAAIPVDGGLSV
jgi:SDR family mycofactocin-dependent oxidoreductase